MLVLKKGYSLRPIRTQYHLVL